MYHPQSQLTSQLAQLPLAKFSYTTTSIGHNGPLNWNHVIGNGDLAGKFEKWPDGSASGRVILKVSREQETLEEIDLTHFIRDANSNPSKKPSFAVIVKSPCLAVKYPNGDTYLRRFQIKFASDRDYYTALAILSDINCPFSESNIGSAPSGRKLTSSSWNLGVSRESRVGNMSASSDVFPLQTPVPGSGVSRIPGISPNMVLDETRFTGGSPSFSPHVGLPIHQNSPPAHPEPNLLTESLPTRISRPLTATTTGTMPVIPRPPSSSFSPHIPPTFPGPPSSQNSSTVQQPEPSLLVRSSPGTISRPSTATPCHDPQALERVLPPRRELPFTKPGAKQARAGERGMNTNPNELANTTDENKSKSKNTQHPLSPITVPSPAPTETAAQPSGQPPSSQTKANRDQHQNQNSRQKSKLCILRLPTKPSSTPAPQPNTQSHTQPERDTNPFPLPSPTNLTTYHNAATPEQLSTIETWILEHLEDDGFLEFCRDVEGVWGRIAFGR